MDSFKLVFGYHGVKYEKKIEKMAQEKIFFEILCKLFELS